MVVGLPGFGGLGLGLTEGEGMGEGVEGGKGWVEKWFAPGKTTASACTAIAYAAGLMCGWGTIWGLEMVVFGGYQGWAMRVRRRLRRSRGGGDGNGEKGDEKEDDGEKQKGVEGNLNGGASMNGNDVNTNGNTIRKRKTQQSQSPGEKHEEKGKKWTVDETVDLEKYEYYWEPYPDNGTFWERLDWVMDIFNSFRGAGTFLLPLLSSPFFSFSHPRSQRKN